MAKKQQTRAQRGRRPVAAPRPADGAERELELGEPHDFAQDDAAPEPVETTLGEPNDFAQDDAAPEPVETTLGEPADFEQDEEAWPPVEPGEQDVEEPR